jgi:hypothetical protein
MSNNIRKYLLLALICTGCDTTLIDDKPPVETDARKPYIFCTDYETKFRCNFIHLEEVSEVYKVICEDKTLAIVPKQRCFVIYRE